MKWFKHYSDAYTNLKLRQILREFGVEGYGFYWLILELVAQQGDENFKISEEKGWKESLEFFLMEGQNGKIFDKSFEKDEKNLKKIGTDLNEIVKQRKKHLETILSRFADFELIDKKSLNKAILWVPKMKKFQDEYRDRKGRTPDTIGSSRDNIRQELELEEDKDKEAKLARRGVQGGRGSQASFSKQAFKKIETGNGELEPIISLVAEQNKWPRQFVVEQAQEFFQQNPEWRKTNKAPLPERLRGWIQKAFDSGWVWRCAWGNFHVGKKENGCACEVEVERQRAEREEKMREAWSKCTRGCDQGRISRKNERGYDEIYPCECVIDFFPAAKAEAAKAK